MKKPSEILCAVFTALFVAALVAVTITVSIGIPIYCRFFYYIQIRTLGMEEATGWSYETIRAAYDDVLNYLTLPGHAFGTGELRWSQSGMEHFADCKKLFNLNLGFFIGGAVAALTLGLLARFKVISLARPLGFRPCFLAGVIALALPVVLLLLVLAVGFDAAFVAFHAIFFPGKTNWVFDPRTDEIIQVMPEEFFLNCAVIIAVALVAISVAMIVFAVVRRRRDGVSQTENILV